MILRHPMISEQRIVSRCPFIICGMINEAAFHFYVRCYEFRLGTGETEESAARSAIHRMPFSDRYDRFSSICMPEPAEYGDINSLFNLLLEELTLRNMGKEAMNEATE